MTTAFEWIPGPSARCCWRRRRRRRHVRQPLFPALAFARHQPAGRHRRRLRQPGRTAAPGAAPGDRLLLRFAGVGGHGDWYQSRRRTPGIRPAGKGWWRDAPAPRYGPLAFCAPIASGASLLATGSALTTSAPSRWPCRR